MEGKSFESFVDPYLVDSSWRRPCISRIHADSKALNISFHLLGSHLSKLSSIPELGLVAASAIAANLREFRL